MGWAVLILCLLTIVMMARVADSGGQIRHPEFRSATLYMNHQALEAVRRLTLSCAFASHNGGPSFGSSSISASVD